LGIPNHIQDANTIDLFAFVYGVEAVRPLELQMPSLCIVVPEGLTEDKNHSLYFAELEVLNERRLQA